jgi:GTP-binding protein EngB required for normal cell division
MILRTLDSRPAVNGPEHSDSGDRPAQMAADSSLQSAFRLANELALRYEISALSGLLATTRAAMEDDEITVAVLGRFKAGKSSFLNDFIWGGTGSGPLPVGVIPVTAVITEIRYGARERAWVHHTDAGRREVRLDQIGAYISERENPENEKRAELITIELPELRRFPGLRFVDTPGLESALSHNTQTSLDWLPNVGLALVAVSVDPPLSQSDIDLLKSLYQYTPKVGILLTKADLLSEQELAEVMEYVRSQLAKNLPETPQVFPYSTKPGFECFRQALERTLIHGTLERLSDERDSILSRKVDTLLRECGDYLALSLKSAEMIQSERRALTEQVVGEKEAVDEIKSEIRLVVQHAAEGTRSSVSHHLETHQSELEQALLREFESEFPKWSEGLRTMLSSFENWLANGLCSLRRCRSGSAVYSWRLCIRYKCRYSGLCSSFEIAYRSGRCARLARRCGLRKQKSVWSSLRHRISAWGACLIETGNSFLPFCPYG